MNLFNTTEDINLKILNMKLNGYLAHQALSKIEKKGLFKGKYFWLGEYLSFATATYETSSVL